VEEGNSLLYTYRATDDNDEDGHSLSELLGILTVKGIEISDLFSQKSSLEEIFVSLLEQVGSSEQVKLEKSSEAKKKIKEFGKEER
jgi:ABC-2 type transport system ATP-binding protein